MQDNLINPQAVNEVINTVFGSYEKFVLCLIERRKELEKEKHQLLERLEKINKEQTLIKNTLTGFHGTKIGSQYYNANKNELVDKKPLRLSLSKTQKVNASKPVRFSLFKKQKNDSLTLKSAMTKSKDLPLRQKELTSRQTKVDNEIALIENILKAFHGRKIEGQYYNSADNSLNSEKPLALPSIGSKALPMDSIGKLFSFKKDEYNQITGTEIINESRLYSKQEMTANSSLSLGSLENYRSEILDALHKDYLHTEFATVDDVRNMAVDELNFNAKTAQAHSEGVSADSFTTHLVKEAALEKVEPLKGVKVSHG